MATPIQENLIAKNKAYASSFTEGHLALPPAKKYAVGTTPHPPLSYVS
jgi:carbonic anhydrase